MYMYVFVQQTVSTHWPSRVSQIHSHNLESVLQGQAVSVARTVTFII